MIIEKAGEVIPAVVGVVMEKRARDAKPFDFVKHIHGKCPACGGPIRRDPEFVAWRCENMACPAQLKRTIEHYAARHSMDIENLGEVLINQLVDKELVKDVADLYSLNVEQLADLERMAEKSATNVVTAIAESKNRELWRLINGLGILHVGEGAARKLADHFQSLEKLGTASLEELQQAEDVGPVMAQSIYDFFRNPRNRAVLEKLRQAGVKPQRPEAKEREVRWRTVRGQDRCRHRHARQVLARSRQGGTPQARRPCDGQRQQEDGFSHCRRRGRFEIRQGAEVRREDVERNGVPETASLS